MMIQKTNRPPLDLVLSRLDHVREVPGGFSARCPSHEDRNASLSVSVGDDDRILMHCHANCEIGEVLKAAGLTTKDLFPQTNGHAIGNGNSRIVATYAYKDESGATLFEVCRFDPKDFRQRKPKEGGGWDWKTKGVRKVPYRLPELLAAPATETVFVAEGEKDVANLVALGCVATCNAGGAGKWRADYGPHFQGRRVVVLGDKDEAGRKHAEHVAAMLNGVAAEVKILELPGAGKDVSDWLASGGTKDELLKLAEAAEASEPPKASGKVDAAGEFGVRLRESQLARNGKPAAPQADEPAIELPAPMGIESLVGKFPTLREPVIQGLLRRGETANLIAAPKVGKSWSIYALLLCVIMGWKWLDRYLCSPGRILLIDNELHGSTLAQRIPAVAAAMGIRQADYVDGFDVLSLRGRLMDLEGIARTLEKIEPDVYSLVVLDAFYRVYPPGISENDNASVAMLYNRIDQVAARLNCAWLNVHHASKGMQGDKGITDVGAGAGSQSRAADTHIILRQHEEEEAVVLEAVVRSFAPVEPLPLRWSFPLWTPDDELDPRAVRGRLAKGEQRQNDKDKDGLTKLRDGLKAGPATARELRRRTGLSRERIERLLDKLESAKEVGSTEIEIKGNECREYRLKETKPDVGG